MKDLAILIPSWRGHDLLNACLNAIKKSCVTDYDVIVILNDPTEEDIEVIRFHGVRWISCSVNLGTLAVDLAIPLIKGKYKYVANLNNDMLVCPNWDELLLTYFERNNCISVSSPAIEYNGGNNGIDTLNDASIPTFTSEDAYTVFSQNYKDGKYVLPECISQRHPVITKTDDFLSIGGYSDNWDTNWWPGYTLDFYFPWRLWNLKGSNNMVSVGMAPVFHDYSATMKKLPLYAQSRNGWHYFKQKTGITVDVFKDIIEFNKIV